MKLHFAIALSVTVLTSIALSGESSTKGVPFNSAQAAQNDDGQKNQKDDGQQNQGVVKAVDPARNSITVSVARQGRQIDQIMTLPKNVPVVIGGKVGTVADLKPGMRVGLSLSKDKKAVVGIREVPANVGKQNRGQNNKGDGQQNQNDDGQQNRKDDGRQNQKDDGR